MFCKNCKGRGIIYSIEEYTEKDVLGKKLTKYRLVEDICPSCKGKFEPVNMLIYTDEKYKFS